MNKEIKKDMKISENFDRTKSIFSVTNERNQANNNANQISQVRSSFVIALFEKLGGSSFKREPTNTPDICFKNAISTEG